MSDHIQRAERAAIEQADCAEAGYLIYRGCVTEDDVKDIVGHLAAEGLLVTDTHEDMEQRLAEFLCEQTGGLLSKTGYDVRTMVQAADDYYRECYDKDRAEHDAVLAGRIFATFENVAKVWEGNLTERVGQEQADTVREAMRIVKDAFEARTGRDEETA